MTSAELRREATKNREKIAKLVALAEKEDRELNPDEAAVIDELRTKITSLENRAKIAETVEADAEEITRSAGRVGNSIEFDRLEPGESEADRQRSFGDWLFHVDSVCDRRSTYEQVETSRGLLEKMYRSKYREWSDKERRASIDAVPGKGGYVRPTTEQRNLAMNSGTAGGFLMPNQFYDKLMEVAAPMSLVRPRAMVLPMTGETVEIPSLDQTTAPSAGSPAYFGGVIVTWSGESASITSTEPGFRQTKITLNEVTAYTPVGRTLIQRSPISLEPLIFRLFGGALGWAEDYNFFRGPGGGKPIGVINPIVSARIKTAARGSSTAITMANATAVWTKVHETSQSAGAWFVSKAAESAVLNMAGTSNQVFIPTGVYLAQNMQAVANAGPSGVSLFQRPVVITSKLPALNTDGDFNFFDFSQYIIADGGPPEVATSDDYLFRTNERAFRIVKRVGGSPWLNNPITLEDGSTTVSPFVSLEIQ